MATADEEEQRMQLDENDDDANTTDPSDSEDGISGDDDPTPKVEWLATGRERRSTAGNRMKSMIAAEEPDDELELLFAEDADDAGFTEVEDDGSDAQMSSSEDEDAQENGDELEGEQELEKQARESRQAARKRKAQEAIPLKFRKKVRIDISQTSSASATPAAPKPRPKKKSERMSWLPSPAEMPTRASKRETTMAGKEQLHKQMAEREIKRLRQIEAMERKAKKMEALKKPPMTQAERLAEAALVEKRNAKSLNRWEEAEKQREEERKAKLAALNNRTLEGPVVTFWSGVGEWIDGKLKHVGKTVTIEEKPVKKKRHSAIGLEGAPESSCHDKAGQTDNIQSFSKDKTASDKPVPSPPNEASAKPEMAKEAVAVDVRKPTDLENGKPAPSVGVIQEAQPTQSEVVSITSDADHTTQDMQTTQSEGVSNLPSPRVPESKPPESKPQSPNLPPADTKPADLKLPDLQPPSTNMYTTSMFAPPSQSSLMKPPELKPLPNSFLAPPAGVSQSGLSMPMIGYHPSPNTNSPSNVLALPNPAQRQSPLSMPQTNIHPTHTAPTPSRPAQTTSPKSASLIASPAAHIRSQPKAPLSTLKPTKANAQKHQPKETALLPPPSLPANGKATRNCIILQNFNENAVREKTVQTRILFGREMNKLPKQGPAPRCVITNHPARYKDPTTGLPYYNAYAFKEIQKLQSGEYRWSSLVGAWVGSGTSAATGVPARFLDPDAPGPPKEEDAPDPPPKENEVAESSGETAAASQTAEQQPVKVRKPSIPQSNHVATPVTPGQPSSSVRPANATIGADITSTTLGEADTLPVVGGLGSSVQPYIATTEATFALDESSALPSSELVLNNATSETIDSMGSTLATTGERTSSGLQGPPTATDAGSLASSAPPMVIEQEVIKQ